VLPGADLWRVLALVGVIALLVVVLPAVRRDSDGDA
jgi:hypothetical protein